MDLIKLHMDNVGDLVTRRISHLKQPFVARSVLSGLDYRLLASLSALRATSEVPLTKLDTSQPLKLFLDVFHGLQHDLNATVEVIDDAADSLDDSAHTYLEQAFQLAAVTPKVDDDLTATSHLSRRLLLTYGTQLPDNWLQQGLQDFDDNLAALCIFQLGQQNPQNHHELLQEHSQNQASLTRLAALLALARRGCPQASTSLTEQTFDTLQLSLPALHAACWLHPEKFAECSPLALAFSGNPAVLPQLIEQMAHASTMADAYQGWLWLTARNLPHYPAVQAADATAKPVAPTPRTQPDSAAAEHWVAQQKWSAEQRYFLGQALDAPGLKRLSHRFTGRCLDLVANHQQLQGPVCPLSNPFKRKGNI